MRSARSYEHHDRRPSRRGYRSSRCSGELRKKSWLDNKKAAARQRLARKRKLSSQGRNNWPKRTQQGLEYARKEAVQPSQAQQSEADQQARLAEEGRVARDSNLKQEAEAERLRLAQSIASHQQQLDAARRQNQDELLQLRQAAKQW